MNDRKGISMSDTISPIKTTNGVQLPVQTSEVFDLRHLVSYSLGHDVLEVVHEPEGLTCAPSRRALRLMRVARVSAW